MRLVPKLFFAYLMVFSAGSVLFADDDVDFSFRTDMRHTGDEEDGFVLRTALSVPISYSYSKSRMGIADGNYLELEGRLMSSIHYIRDKHDWSTSLFLAESFKMSPAIKNRFIKSEDLLRFETRYLYNFLPYMGAYAHARAETSIFDSVDIHDKETQYELRDINDNARPIIKAKEMKISDAFFPLFFQENLGIFATVINHKSLVWETRAAMSFRQTLANGQRVFVEEKNDILIIKDLQDSFQIGPSAGTSISGKFLDKKISYAAGIDAMWPFFSSPKPTNRSFAESLIVQASASVGLNITKWLALEYEYNAKRIPDILPKFQQSHNVHLNLNFDWVYRFGQA